MKDFYSLSGILFVFMSAFLLLSEHAEVQSGYILSGFRYVQQSSYLNPAFISGANIVVGVPLLSNFSTGLVSSSGGLSNFFSQKDGSGSLILDLSKTINNSLPEEEAANITDISLLFAGFKAGSTFITLGVRQHLFVRAIILDSDLLNLFWGGGSGFENQFFDMNSTAFTKYHLTDYHVGIYVPIGTKLRVGARIHLLQGLSDISTKSNDISMKTVRNSKGDLEVHARTCFDPGKYLSDFFNLGFSMDLRADFSYSQMDNG